jgi:pimeloyl-ACP methyl ester carboxylesterase
VGADLPTCCASDASVGPLDDVAYLRELLAGIDGPVIAVGKSYGGVVISGASAGCANVQHLVYVAAMMPTAEEPFQQTIAAAMHPEFAAGVRMLADGRLEMDADIGATHAFSQASKDEQDMWRRHGSPMSFGADPSVTLGQVGWVDVDSTYVVCTEDRALQVAAQRAWAVNATTVIERPWDHSPGVSHPDELADLLAELAS